MAETERRPFSGLKVIDFTAVLSGPSCTRLLADLGADVIKVEAPEGDRIRYSGPKRGDFSATFAQLNCGKRNLCVDLKTPQGIEIVRKLAADADILVENVRPMSMAQMGLGYEQMRAINPKIVYCSISGFGQTGPYAKRLAYAPIIHATSGFDRAQMRDRDGTDAPRGTGVLVADFVGGLTAYAAIATALYHRALTGEGQYIDCALIDGIMQILSCEIHDGQFPDLVGPRLDYPPVKAADGWLVIVPTSQPQFIGMAQAMGHPEWIEDARFGPYAARMANSRALTALVQEWASERTAAEIDALMERVKCPCSIILRMRDIFAHPQMLHRGSLVEIEDGGGKLKVGATPFRFSAMAGRPVSRVAGLGEDNREILTELGYSAAQIDAIELAGVVKRG